MDAIIIRAVERIIVAFGGIIFAYLGYRLYVIGITKGRGELKAESKFYTLIFSGTGPGLFFMMFGGLILLTSLFTGYAEKTEVAKKDKSGNVITEQAVKNISNDNLKKGFNFQKIITDPANKTYCFTTNKNINNKMLSDILSVCNKDCNCISSSEEEGHYTIKDDLVKKIQLDNKTKKTASDSNEESSGKDNK